MINTLKIYFIFWKKLAKTEADKTLANEVQNKI
jgi:hypothetical protein